MSALPIVLSVLALIASAHSWVFISTADWHLTQARLWMQAPATARQRAANRPWYVRYAARFGA